MGNQEKKKRKPRTSYRYEDIAENPRLAARRIFELSGVPMDAAVTRYVESHTTAAAGGRPSPGGTFRDSRRTAARWRTEGLNFSEVESIQGECRRAMELWGYARFGSREEAERDGDRDDAVLPNKWSLDGRK